MSASTNIPASRARNQNRKKPNDDASYFGPSTSMNGPATKRLAVDKLDGEPRTKRKRAEPVPPAAAKKDLELEPKASLINFNKMTTEVLHQYMAHFDIVPAIYPSPLSPEDPPAPSMLIDGPQPQSSRPSTPPAPSTTPANRPRRESRDQSQRRRSSRFLDEDLPYRTPALAEIQDLHGVLATIVEKHYREAPVRELDTLSIFMSRVEKSKGTRPKF